MEKIMEQTPLKYCAWLYFYFLDTGNTQYIQLNENVNGEILQRAVDEAVKVHPWVNFALDINGSEIKYKDAGTPFKAIEMYGPQTWVVNLPKDAFSACPISKTRFGFPTSTALPTAWVATVSSTR